MTGQYLGNDLQWRPIATVSGGGLSYAVNSGTTYPANVTSVTLPPGLTHIGDYAFYGFTSLPSVVFPSGVKAIGSSAFYGCTSLTSVIIPSGVTTIKTQTFSGCTSLVSVDLPSTVSSTGTNAFRGCTSLMELTVRRPTPPMLGGYALSGVPTNCVIRVPAESVAAYQTASGWSDRATYITAI